MNFKEDIEAAMTTLHEGRELIFVIDPQVLSANDVNSLKELFQDVYRAKFGGALKIDSMKRDQDTQLLISVFTKKEEEE